MRYLAAIVLVFSYGCADGNSPVEPTPSPPGPAQLTFSLWVCTLVRCVQTGSGEATFWSRSTPQFTIHGDRR
jgi:hypothetical protein